MVPSPSIIYKTVDVSSFRINKGTQRVENSPKNIEMNPSYKQIPIFNETPLIQLQLSGGCCNIYPFPYLFSQGEHLIIQVQ